MSQPSHDLGEVFKKNDQGLMSKRGVGFGGIHSLWESVHVCKIRGSVFICP